MSIQFVNFTEDEFLAKKLLYRYMPLEYALKTLNDKEIWFANPKVWKDPFEKRFIGAKISHGTKVADFPWKGKVYCFCTTQTATSEAYWKAYSRDQIGVELKIRRQALLDVLKGISNKCDIYIGRVEYMKTKDIIWRDLNKIPFSYQDHFTLNDKMCARLLLLKRIAFTYEDEVRIMIVQKERDNDKSGIGVKYYCENTDLFNSLTLDPSLSDNTTKILKEVFETKYGFTPIQSSNGMITKRVLKSQLYSEQKPKLLSF